MWAKQLQKICFAVSRSCIDLNIQANQVLYARQSIRTVCGMKYFNYRLQHSRWVRRQGKWHVEERSHAPPKLQPEEQRMIQAEEHALGQLIRFHNSSIPYRKGRHIVGKFLCQTEKYCLLETGFKQACRVGVNELTTDKILKHANGIKDREGPQDFIFGDEVLVQVEELETPFGDMWLSGKWAHQQYNITQVMKELEQSFLSGSPVFGRVLNDNEDGLSVGIAGIVAHLPYRLCTPITAKRSQGRLKKFYVEEIDRHNRVVVLRDAQMPKTKQQRPDETAALGPGKLMIDVLKY